MLKAQKREEITRQLLRYVRIIQAENFSWRPYLVATYIRRAGRMGRAHFTWALLLLAIMVGLTTFVGFWLLDMYMGSHVRNIHYLLVLFAILGLYQRPAQAIYAKRLHDLDMSSFYFFAAWLMLYISIGLMFLTQPATTTSPMLYHQISYMTQDNPPVHYEIFCVFSLLFVMAITLMMLFKAGSARENFYGAAVALCQEHKCQ